MEFVMTTVEINNPAVEAFLYQQAKVNHIEINEYLSSIVMYQMELESVKEDLNQMEKEIQDVNNGDLQLQSAHTLLDEL
jgi:FtsZ-binding cell division protein ZapB